jgi:hypothetical protein
MFYPTVITVLNVNKVFYRIQSQKFSMTDTNFKEVQIVLSEILRSHSDETPI